MFKKLLLCLSVIFISLFLSNCILEDTKEKLESTLINEVDLTEVSDGEYEGFYDAYMIKAKVKVSVADHRITNVEIIEHDTGKGKKAEQLTDIVVEKQSLKVDAISGATGSSKVILKAIELALIGETDE